MPHAKFWLQCTVELFEGSDKMRRQHISYISHAELVLLEFQNISSCSILVDDQNLNSITLQGK